MNMSLFDQSGIDPNMTGATMMMGNNMSQHINVNRGSEALLKNDFLNEMGMKGPDLLTEEEKQGLEDKQNTDLD